MTSTAEDVPHDWITLHRLRFPEALSAKARSFPPVVSTAATGSLGFQGFTSNVFPPIGF